MRAVLLSITALLIFATAPAEARHYRHAHATVAVDPGCNIIMPCEGVTLSPRGVKAVRAVGFGVATPIYTPAPDYRGKVTDRRGRLVRYIDAAPRVAAAAQVVEHPAGCPRIAFCGCGAAVKVFGSPVRSLWLAANWFKFPRAAPAPGMVAVRAHHVFVLEASLGGDTWQVYDANSGGHATRIHARSLHGYTVVNPRA